MTISPSQYDSFLNYASVLIRQKKVQCSPVDIVGDALISAYEYNCFDEKLIIGKMHAAVFSELNHERLSVTYNDWKLPCRPNTYDRTCLKCLQVLPEAFFKVKVYSDKPNCILDVCADCYRKNENEQAKSNYLINKALNKPAKQDSSYFKSFRDSLPDSYIRGCLIKYGVNKELITDEMVKNKRAQVLEKRSRKMQKG